MIRPFYVIGTIVVCIAAVVLVYANRSHTTPDAPAVLASDTIEIYTGPTHSLRHYDADRFLDGIVYAEQHNPESSYRISGGITPHHLYPGFILADFYMRIGKQNPGTVLIIGPNHTERGGFPFITSAYGWETPFGMVAPDTKIITSLVAAGMAAINEEVVPADHAVAGQLPFLKFYAPQARIIPLLVSGTVTEEESKTFAAALSNLLPLNTIVIAAVDFSHYLNAQEAARNDGITLDTMKIFDYAQLYRMTNDYIDSPPSIGILLMLMQYRGTTAQDVLHNTNSGLLQQDNTIQTTSYFSILFH